MTASLDPALVVQLGLVATVALPGSSASIEFASHKEVFVASALVGQTTALAIAF